MHDQFLFQDLMKYQPPRKIHSSSNTFKFTPRETMDTITRIKVEKAVGEHLFLASELFQYDRPVKRSKEDVADW